MAHPMGIYATRCKAYREARDSKRKAAALKIRTVAAVQIQNRITRYDDKGNVVAPKGDNLVGWGQDEYGYPVRV